MDQLTNLAESNLKSVFFVPTVWCGRESILNATMLQCFFILPPFFSFFFDVFVFMCRFILQLCGCRRSFVSVYVRIL